MQNIGSSDNLHPPSAYEEKPKKRVKSAVKRPKNYPNQKLEEMRRWLEYQRKFTAEELKKRSEIFKEAHEERTKIDTTHEREPSRTDIKRRYKNYDQVTHPYQSTVDDLLRSRYAMPDEPFSLPAVKSEVKRTSPGRPLTLIGFDDLDSVSVHKRK